MISLIGSQFSSFPLQTLLAVTDPSLPPSVPPDFL